MSTLKCEKLIHTCFQQIYLLLSQGPFLELHTSQLSFLSRYFVVFAEAYILPPVSWHCHHPYHQRSNLHIGC